MEGTQSGNPISKNGKFGPTDGFVQRLAGARVAAVNKGCTAGMLEPVAVGFHRIVVVNLKPLPSPSVVQFTGVVHHPCDVLDHAVKRPRKRQVAQFSESLFDKRCADDRERAVPVPVGDVLALKKKNGKAKHVVAVNVRDEHGFDFCDVFSMAS